MLTWEQFRLRYEDEVLPGLAPKNRAEGGRDLQRPQSILPKVKAGLLRELTAERISFLQADLRRRGRAKATIAGHLGHLRAALNWAVDQGLLAAMPKIRRPKRAAQRPGRSDEGPADHHGGIRADARQDHPGPHARSGEAVRHGLETRAEGQAEGPEDPTAHDPLRRGYAVLAATAVGPLVVGPPARRGVEPLLGPLG